MSNMKKLIESIDSIIDGKDKMSEPTIALPKGKGKFLGDVHRDSSTPTPKKVRDRKTGEMYDPDEKFNDRMNSPEVIAQFKRMKNESISVDELTEELKAAFEDYVGDKYNADTLYAPIAKKKPSKDQAKLKKVKVPEPNAINELDASTVTSYKDKSKRDLENTIRRSKRLDDKNDNFGRGPKEMSKADSDKQQDNYHRIGKRSRGLGRADARTDESNVMNRVRERAANNDSNNTEVDEANGENRAHYDRIRQKNVVAPIDRERYTDLSHEGLEGPFRQKNGQVLYYDNKAGKYYNRDTDFYISDEDHRQMNEVNNSDSVTESDPDIPADIHDKMIAKRREEQRQQLLRRSGEENRRKVDAGVNRYASHLKNPSHAVESKADRARNFLNKLQEMSGKLAKLKGTKSLKEAPIDQTVAPAAPGQTVQTANPTKPAPTGQPVPGQPLTPSQQAPAPKGLPTAPPVAGQPAAPAAGQAGGAPIAAPPGTPLPPSGGQVNAATTPIQATQQMAQQFAQNPAAANQAMMKLNNLK